MKNPQKYESSNDSFSTSSFNSDLVSDKGSYWLINPIRVKDNESRVVYSNSNSDDESEWKDEVVCEPER